MVSKSFYDMRIFSARSYGIEIFYPLFSEHELSFDPLSRITTSCVETLI